MKYEVVLFDFDYTLADSSLGIVTCFQTILKRYGHLTVADEAIKRTIGKTLEDSFSILSGVTDANQLATWRKEYEKEANTHMNINTYLYPDALEVLKHLKESGVKVGIISTKYRYRILDFFEKHLPNDWFDVIVGGEDVTKHKPNPEGVEIALKRLGVPVSRILYIGDSVVDAETAVNAHVTFIGVTNGMTTKEELEKYPHLAVISELKGLLSYL